MLCRQWRNASKPAIQQTQFTQHKNIHWPKHTSQNCSYINHRLPPVWICKRSAGVATVNGAKVKENIVLSISRPHHLQQCKARPQNARNMAEQAGNQVQQCYCGKSVPNALMREVMEVRAALGKSSVALSFIGCRKQKKISMNLKLVLQPPRRTNETGKGLDCQCTPLQLQLLSTSWSLSESGLGKVTQANVRQLKPEQWCKRAASPKTSKKYFKKRGSKSHTVNSCSLETRTIRIQDGIQAYGFKAQCFRFLNHRFSMNSMFSQGTLCGPFCSTEPSRMVVFAKGCHWNRRKWPLAEHPDSGLDHDSHRPCFAR